MQFPRAGLFTAVIALCAALALAAPLPVTSSSSNLASISKTDLQHPTIHMPYISPRHVRQETTTKTQQIVVPRSDSRLAPRDDVELVRRKSILTKIKQGFKKLAHGIKHVAQKIGHGIKTAAKKVGHFIKTTGAKIVKVGLKIMATAGKIASKIVSFVPGIGKLASKGIEAVSTVRDKISNAIHVNIGGRLGKAMHRMDKAQKVVGYIPRDLPETYQERELELEDYYSSYGSDFTMDARNDYGDWIYEGGSIDSEDFNL